jgi:hypothetical protein
VELRPDIGQLGSHDLLPIGEVQWTMFPRAIGTSLFG